MKCSFLGACLLTVAFAATLPACDSNKDAPDEREDEGGDADDAKADEGAKDETGDEQEEAQLADDGSKATPKPATPTPETTTAKSDDFKKADTFDKTDGAGTAGDETKKADDGTGATPIGATPIKSDKRGAGSGTGGPCPCMRGLVCCSGTCKASCS